MAKSKSVFFCNECGYESSGWLGKCPGCGAWNTFVEEKVQKDTKRTGTDASLLLRMTGEATPITAVSVTQEDRVSSGMRELDRVLGGGIVKGSLSLVAGDPGIGKSTLLLMLSGHLARSGSGKVLYVSGEESVRQIKMRAERLSVNEENLYLVPETSLDVIRSWIEKISPAFVVIDSIQTLYDDTISSAPGSVSQVREITGELMRLAKSLQITMFIVGHVTKEGSIAGPRVLEHMVDTVLYFEGERHLSYRILRCVKNRFGSTNEIGVFEMRESGLEEVANPSLSLLSGRPEDAPGTAVVCTLEGSRPMLIEVQALICESSFAVPRRMTTGMDYNRVSMLLAVLEKRAGLRLGRSDAFVNVIGGIRLLEPAVDLAVVAAILSSYKNKPLDPHMVLFGEMGLTGEIRAVGSVEKRLSEAVRLGFTTCVAPAGNKKAVDAFQQQAREQNVSLILVRSIGDVVKNCFGGGS